MKGYKHLFDRVEFSNEPLVGCIVKEAEVARQEQVVFRFAGRAHRNLDKTRLFRSDVDDRGFRVIRDLICAVPSTLCDGETCKETPDGYPDPSRIGLRHQLPPNRHS